MANRQAEDIRRIAKVDEARGGLSTASERDNIDGVRGVGYINSEGSAVGVTGAPGETLAPESTSSFEDVLPLSPSDDQITSEDEGVAVASSVLDGDLNLGDKLEELQTLDCASGVDMDIRTDGEFVPPSAVTVPDADGNLIELSIAWTDASTPPDKQGFFLGFEWKNGSPGLVGVYGTHATNIDALNAHIAGHTAANPSTFTGGFAYNQVDALDGSSYAVAVDLDLVAGGTALQSFAGQSTSCTPGSSLSCPTTNPVETQWPVDTQNFEFKHTFRDGKFISNEFDSQVPTENIADLAQIDFCNDVDARIGRIEGTSNGGFMISERDSIGGAAISQYQVFDSEGTLTDFVGEATADLLRPNTE